MDFKPGDVVKLKSGGPPMTIESVQDEEALCVWFDGPTQHKDHFALVLLKPFKRGVASVRVVR